jgi:hypothetical protein
LQDLWLHQQDSTWGRLLLSGVAQPQWPQEFERMADTAEAIQSNARHHTYESVGHVPWQEIEAAAAAAAPGSNSSSSRQHVATTRAAATTSAVTNRGPPQPAAAAAEELGSSSSGSGGSGDSWQPSLPLQQQKRQVLQDHARQQRVMQRHMVDKQLLPWFTSPDLTHATSECVCGRGGG